MKFEKQLLLQFSALFNTLVVVADNNESILLRREEASSTFANLIDKYAWWKIDITYEMKRDDFSWTTEEVPEEYKYDYEEDMVIRVLLKKELRVKTFYDKQNFPAKFRKALPKGVKKELLATRKQIQYIESLLSEVDFLFPYKELFHLTKREASALINLLQTLKSETEPEPEPMPF